MKNKRIGCLSSTGIIAAIITTLVIAGYAYAQGGLMYNPGSLNAQSDGEVLGGISSHAETNGNCKACHTAPWESAKMSDRCVDCHEALAVEIQSVESLHGSILHGYPELTCWNCHTEHRGADAKLTEVNGAAFPHELVGFSLKGHQHIVTGEAFVCSDCHVDNISRFDLKTCDTCHLQMDMEFMTGHTSSFGSACLDCHDGSDGLSANFNHDKSSFPLTGQHLGLACARCHSAGQFAGLTTSCADCHSEPVFHAGIFGLDCAKCHSTEDWLAGYNGPHPIVADEGGSGVNHGEASCRDCHTQTLSIATCLACHDSNNPDDDSGGGGDDDDD